MKIISLLAVAGMLSFLSGCNGSNSSDDTDSDNLEDNTSICPAGSFMQPGQVLRFDYTYVDGTTVEYQVDKERDGDNTGYVTITNSDGLHNRFQLKDVCVSKDLSLSSEELFLVQGGDAIPFPSILSTDDADDTGDKVAVTPQENSVQCSDSRIEVTAGSFDAIKCLSSIDGDVYQTTYNLPGDEGPLRGLVYLEQEFEEGQVIVELTYWEREE